VQLRERVDALKRLAFYIIAEEEAGQAEWVHLTGSKPEDIDVMVMPGDEDDLDAMRRALDCYVSYAATIESHLDGPGIKRNIPREAVFAVCREAHDPPLDGLSDGFAEESVHKTTSITIPLAFCRHMMT
jgi:hypothetical protein